MSLKSKAFWIKIPIIGGNPNIQVVPLREAQKDKKEIMNLLAEVLRQACEYEQMMESKVKNLEEQLTQTKQDKHKIMGYFENAMRRKAVAKKIFEKLETLLNAEYKKHTLTEGKQIANTVKRVREVLK